MAPNLLSGSLYQDYTWEDIFKTTKLLLWLKRGMIGEILPFKIEETILMLLKVMLIPILLLMGKNLFGSLSQQMEMKFGIFKLYNRLPTISSKDSVNKELQAQVIIKENFMDIWLIGLPISNKVILSNNFQLSETQSVLAREINTLEELTNRTKLQGMYRMLKIGRNLQSKRLLMEKFH